jgi:hypothetical protein
LKFKYLSRRAVSTELGVNVCAVEKEFTVGQLRKIGEPIAV